MAVGDGPGRIDGNGRVVFRGPPMSDVKPMKTTKAQHQPMKQPGDESGRFSHATTRRECVLLRPDSRVAASSNRFVVGAEGSIGAPCSQKFHPFISSGDQEYRDDLASTTHRMTHFVISRDALSSSQSRRQLSNRTSRRTPLAFRGLCESRPWSSRPV